MKSLFGRLKPEQKTAALCYRGEEAHGEDDFRISTAKAMEVAKRNGATVHPRIERIVKYGQERTLPSAAESAPASKPFNPSIKTATDGSNACGKMIIIKTDENSTDTGSVT